MRLIVATILFRAARKSNRGQAHLALDTAEALKFGFAAHI
jgi:hypothetical protein